MVITYFGHSFLLLEGKEYSIALDPYKGIGLEIPSVTSDYVFCSHEHFDHNNVSAVKNAKRVEDGGNFKIIKTYHDDSFGAIRGTNNVLLFTLDGIKMAFLGDFGESDNKGVINALKGVDILFIPIGGTYTIDALTAKRYVDEIQPKTIVPIHYKIKGVTVEIDGVKTFLNLFDGYKKVASPYNYNNDSGVLLITPEKGDINV